MDRFVEIINTSKVRSNTNLVVAGISVNQSEWNKYQFYPNVIEFLSNIIHWIMKFHAF